MMTPDERADAEYLANLDPRDLSEGDRHLRRLAVDRLRERGPSPALALEPLLPTWALTDDEVELLAFHSHYYEGESLEEIEMTTILTKIASNGQAVEVREVPGSAYEVEILVDGASVGTGRFYAKPPKAELPAIVTHLCHAGGKMYGFTGTEGRTIERRLKEIEAARLAAQEADPEFQAWQAVLAAEDRRDGAHDAAYGDNPRYSDTGREFGDLGEAEEAVVAARAAYLAAFGETGRHWAERQAEAAEEAARRKRDHEEYMRRTGGWGD